MGVGVPGGVANNVSDHAHQLNYLRSHTAGALMAVQLELGTETFTPGLPIRRE